MKVYTRTGDEGMTGLVGGSRVSKASERLEAYGTIDELNSQLGWLLCEIDDEMGRNCIIGCQNMLFGIGAVLAGAEDSLPDPVEEIEHEIDALSEGLPKWRGFTLPGGCEAAARAHVCRTVCRRAERRIIALKGIAEVPAWILKYVNRLSDLLYVLAQRENFLAGKDEIIWQKRL